MTPTTHSPQLTVKKRNGQQIPFFQLRITQAIESACKDHLKIPHEVALPDEWKRRAEKVTERVVARCQARAQETHQSAIFIEEIQDAVIAELRRSELAEIAEGYAEYRHRHEWKRFENERLTIAKRDGRVVSFKPEKITIAIGKAFAAGHADPLSVGTQQIVLQVSDCVVAELKAAEPAVRTISIEEIQDLVERALMELGHHETARRYIVYREERRRERATATPPVLVLEKNVQVKAQDGSLQPLDVERLKLSIAEVCRGLEDDVSVEQVLRRTLASCFDGITTDQLYETIGLSARSLVEKEPGYSFVAARLLLKKTYREALGSPVKLAQAGEHYPEMFEKFIRRAVAIDRLNPEMLQFDLQRLGKALRPERDLQFSYMGLQTLYDRYFIHDEGRRLEAPQSFWMRVAMGLSLREKASEREAWVIRFYEVISSFRYIPSTPTLFNAGTQHPQLSSCFLTTVGDDLDHIFKCIKDNALLSKWSGGLGNDWTPVRALGSWIKGTNGKSQGIVPFLKVANDTAVAVNQGGKRQGAVCAYLEMWHLDVEEFLELRKNTGDDRRRTHDMHTAAWIPDLFMKRVVGNGTWTLLSPNEAPDLHDLYGKAFEERYEQYEALARDGKLKQQKTVSAVELWRKTLSMLFETGHPWITFKDPSNIRSPQDHAGVVHSSNLCTEILLNTSRGETAVCNLGSVNLAEHTSSTGLQVELLADTVKLAIRMLDNVIDLNFYPTSEAQAANQRHRPVGLGIMGFQDALYIQGLSFSSERAVEFSDESMEQISYHAILASSELASERGSYGSFLNSKWSRGLLPIDTVELLERERGGWLQMDKGCRLDWSPVRESIRRHGMRNSNTMAIAPTATIANIVGVSQSVEPTYKNLYVKSNLSGEFTTINPYLIEELKGVGLWDEQMVSDLKYFDGSLREIERIPQSIRDRYITAFEIGYEWLIECASRRQKWIDMGQSLNLYLAQPSGKKLHSTYAMAWEKGLKTTYYLRSLGATRIEKSTLDVNRYGDPLGQGKQPTVKATVADATACSIVNGDQCEACQ